MEALKGHVKIGLHQDVEVQFARRFEQVAGGASDTQLVSQAFCSALSCAYCKQVPLARWETFARLVLEATCAHAPKRTCTRAHAHAPAPAPASPRHVPSSVARRARRSRPCGPRAAAAEGLHGRRYEATLWAAACAPGSNRHRPARYPKELPAQARLRAVRTALLGVHARVCV